jgi:oxalate decarboxylase/phosphoglucose isomerase-like protein (cupin superfamily)
MPSPDRSPESGEEGEMGVPAEERRVSAKEFPVSKTITGVILDLHPGALRELHWHPHANEWLYFVSGKARMGLFGSHGRHRIEEFDTGDAGYIPQGFGHYIENTGDKKWRQRSATYRKAKRRGRQPQKMQAVACCFSVDT